MTTTFSALWIIVLTCLTAHGVIAAEPQPPWKARLSATAESLSGRPRTVARFLASDTPLHWNDDENRDLAAAVLGWEEGVTLEELVRPGSPVQQAVAALIGDANAAVAREIWLRFATYARFQGRGEYNVVSPIYLRSTDPAMHIGPCLWVVRDFVQSVAAGFTLEGYLEGTAEAKKIVTRSGYSGMYSFVQPFVAYHLDEHDPDGTLLERVKSIFIEWQIGCLFASRRPEAVATLIERTREPTIDENTVRTIRRQANRWSREGFANYADLMYRGDRYEEYLLPTAQLAMSDWLGLGLDHFDIEKYDGAFSAIPEMLADPQAREWAVNSTWSIMWNYVGIWSASQWSVEAAQETILDRLANGNRTQKIGALYFARRLGEDLAQTRARRAIAETVMADDVMRADPILFSLALQCFHGGRYQGGDGDDYRKLPAAERALWFGRIREGTDRLIAANMTGMGGTFFFGSAKLAAACDLDDLFSFMRRLARRSGNMDTRLSLEYMDPAGTAEKWGISFRFDRYGFRYPPVTDELDNAPPPENIREILCRYRSRMNAHEREKLLEWVVRGGKGGPEQQTTLVESFATNPEAAYINSSDLPFTAAEYEKLESFLNGGNSRKRRVLMLKLLQQKPSGLTASIHRLLADSDPNRRRAGLELHAIARRKPCPPGYETVWRDTLAAAGTEENRPVLEPLVNATTSDLDGFGLYDPLRPRAGFEREEFWTDPALSDLFHTNRDELIRLIDAIDQTARAHADETFEWIRGDETLTSPIGRFEMLPPRSPKKHNSDRLDDYPIADVWRETLSRVKPSADCLTLLEYFLDWSFFADYDRKYPALEGAAWYREFVRLREEIRTYINPPPGTKGVYKSFARNLAPALAAELPAAERYRVGRRLLRVLTALPSDEAERTVPAMSERLGRIASGDDALFADYFRLVYSHVYGPGGSDSKRRFLTPESVAHAWRLGLLPRNDFIRMLTTLGRGGNVFEEFTDPKTAPALFAAAPGLREIVDRIVDRTVELESGRGDFETPLSWIAGRIVSHGNPLNGVRLANALRDNPQAGIGDGKWLDRATVTGDCCRARMLQHLNRAFKKR